MPPKKRQKKVEVEAAPPPRTDEQALDDDKHRLMVECCQGVVQVFNNVVKNDWNRPWSVMSPASLSGSGFVISIARLRRPDGANLSARRRCHRTFLRNHWEWSGGRTR